MPMQADSLADKVWSQIYEAIRQSQNAGSIFQGVVTDRDEARRVVWVRELSTDPIPVVGQSQDLMFYSGSARKVTKVLPAVPQKGDVVLLIKTSSDTFRCVGVLTPAQEWSQPGAVGMVPPTSITNDKIAPGSITTDKFASGAVAPDSNLLDGLDSTQFQRADQAHASRLYQTNAQSIPNNTWTALFFDGGEDFDTDNVHVTSGANRTKIQPVRQGYYVVTGVCVFASGGGTSRYAGVAKNGINAADGPDNQCGPMWVSGSPVRLPIASIFSMNGSTDYVELYGFQDSGLGLNTFMQGNMRSRFEAILIRPN